MNDPKVSVICLCHNQSDFVRDAIVSVFQQDHSNVELIVVDDGSTDGSPEVISDVLDGENISFISIPNQIGNCAAFNKGFHQSSGQYIIDLAADDILLPTRISEGLKAFDRDDIGVNFCDAELIDKDNRVLGTHFKRDESGLLIENVLDGDVYKTLIERFYISAPTMMIKREVLEELNGYDENLTYEDFDFWIRSSRNWKYRYTNEILVKKRLLAHSHARNQFSKFSKHQKSTLAVCRKIKELNRSDDEKKALKKRCRYEIKQCILQGNFGLIPSFLAI